MASHGHRLIQQLILMYAELKKAHVTARTLAPETIFVDDQCEQMTFNDVTALAWHHEQVLYFPEASMPYSNRKLNENPLTRAWSNDWDLWSIGMIALEIVVGSELVLLLRTHEEV